MVDFIQFSFRSGVWSKRLHGRSDIEEFDFGLKVGTNWVVEHESGATIRPGLEHIGPVRFDDKTTVLIPYAFNNYINNSYMLMFGDFYMRVLHDGAYVLEAAKAVVSAAANVLTITGHGYEVNDWLQVSGFGTADAVFYNVTAKTTNTVTLEIVNSATVPAFVASGGETVARVFEIPTSYAHDKLKGLNYDQYLTKLTITSRGYPQHEVELLDSGVWTITPIDFTPSILGPTTVTTTPTVAGSAGAVYTVTAVDAEGNESYPATFTLEDASVNITTTEGQIKITWSQVADAVQYRIYRSLFVSTASELTVAQDLGFIGTTEGLSFVDANIVPDFTQTPGTFTDYFTDGSVSRIKITNKGSGYTQAATSVAVTTGTGTGFVGYPVVDEAGFVVAVKILNGGKDYLSTDTVVITGDGTGATATLEATPLTGNFPQALARWRQRRFYGGSDNFPITLYGSKPGQYENFNNANIVNAADGFADDLDLAELTPIFHLTTMPTGLFVFTNKVIGQVSSPQGDSFSAISKDFNPITEAGSVDLRPLRVDREVLFLQAGYNDVIALTPSNLPTYYIDKKINVFCPDFFTEANKVESWISQNNPKKLIWVQREDGTFLSCTYDAKQNMQAWCDHYTAGLVKWVASVRENDTDRMYAIVERGGKKYVERMFAHSVKNTEEHFGVDAALVSALVEPAADVTVTLADGILNVVADSAIFSSGDVGSDVRLFNGRYLVSAFVSSTEINCIEEIAADYGLLTLGLSIKLAQGKWSMTPRYTTLTGLDHLEGQTVQIVANGNRNPDAVVSSGSITLDAPASLVIAGLGYEGELLPLPVSATDQILLHKKKKLNKAFVLLASARDLYYGSDDNSFYQSKERTTEVNGVPIKLATGYREINLSSRWEIETGLRIKKIGPFSGTVLGLVMEVDIGSDQN